MFSWEKNFAIHVFWGRFVTFKKIIATIWAMCYRLARLLRIDVEFIKANNLTVSENLKLLYGIN